MPTAARGVTNAKNETTTTAYDADGRRTQVTDAQNRTAKFVYDDAGKLVETIHPDRRRRRRQR